MSRSAAASFAIHAPRSSPGGDQEARSADRRERNADEQLRVVADARALGGVGPAVVEDELALAVRLDVERARREQAFAVPRDQRPRAASPSRRRRRPRLERREPTPTRETANRRRRARSTASRGSARTPSRGRFRARTQSRRGSQRLFGPAFAVAACPKDSDLDAPNSMRQRSGGCRTKRSLVAEAGPAVVERCRRRAP